MFFSDDLELNATLTGLETLSADQLARIVSPSSIVQPVSVSSRNRHGSADMGASVAGAGAFSYQGLVGESPEMMKLKSLLLKIAPTDTTILLQGESGTGKEVIARAIHHHSPRQKEVFVPVDCAAISENIIESELFGHIKGAFTGADRTTTGLIRSADRGTLFLDEVAELSLPLQAKLLRTLQERAVKPVGDIRLHPVDIRIVAATNINLAESVRKGQFRQDLYYRLNAITIHASPLRERTQDIPALCDHFMRQLTGEGYPEKRISASAMDVLCAYEWPGNIRELENVIRRAITLTSGMVIGAEILNIDQFSFDEPDHEAAEYPASVAFHEREAIRKALKRTRGNRRAAAELLDISEATLYRRLKVYSL
ncbi:MAG: sigma-54-dependent Fis family transcriptional regulator [Chlorobiaceae bacterium]|nr:sigma-54-dependent Fis family transcriptional regulator [Chlorobiaceae bacterium]NTV24846.1 sigma-54-dependent Fis family transcriptional regulator [Chlorobiaceae bacterium]